jgi:hypothetical protein
MDTAIVAIILSCVGVILSLGALIWKAGGQARDINLLMAERAGTKEMQKDVQALKAKDELFWTIVKPHLANIIHSPEHQRRDMLVEKFTQSEPLTEGELVELDKMLSAEANNGVEYKRLPAALLLSQVRIEIMERRKCQSLR